MEAKTVCGRGTTMKKYPKFNAGVDVNEKISALLIQHNLLPSHSWTRFHKDKQKIVDKY